MDINQILVSSGISTTVVVVIGLIYKLCIHFSWRSKCCGYESSMNVDLTPPKESFLINKPPV